MRSIDLEPFLETAYRDESGEWKRLGSSFRGALADYLEEHAYPLAAEFIRTANGDVSCDSFEGGSIGYSVDCNVIHRSLYQDKDKYPFGVRLTFFSSNYKLEFKLSCHDYLTAQNLAGLINKELEESDRE